MSTSVRCRRGFTMIEALIAVGLGAMLVAVAFSAFRAASTTVRAANRLALENAMLRHGVARAHDELDFWVDYDDPTNPAAQPLRAARPWTKDVNGRSIQLRIGMPFTPFKDVWPAAQGTPGDEDDTRWRQDQHAWDPSDLRTWCRANIGERSTSKMWFGRYNIFSTACTTAPDVSARSSPVNDAQSQCYLGAPPAAYHWYPFQIQTLRYALGFYGLLEYAPPNAVFATFDDAIANPLVMTRNGAMTDWYVRVGLDPASEYGSPNGEFRMGETVFAKLPPGRYRCTSMCAYAMINPRSGNAGLNLHRDHRNTFMIGNREPNSVPVDDPSIGLKAFLEKTDVRTPLLRLLPTHWPMGTVAVSRFIKNARPITICKVRSVDPASGRAVALTFSGWGTTLRGARLQRGRDGGWASWDNRVGASNPPTLDDP